jgi:hypothetical protein
MYPSQFEHHRSRTAMLIMLSFLDTVVEDLSCENVS